MIPRVARRMETTLLSSRQALPRPARLYSTPSKARNAPATATASVPPPQMDLPFLGPTNMNDIPAFLSRNMPITLIPTPEHSASSTESAESVDKWFVDSQSHEMVGIIDACLHNFHDVKRAQAMFNRLRTRIGSAALTTRMYNNFIEVYCQMATREPNCKMLWYDEAWALYNILETEVDGVQPSPKTYALIFEMLVHAQTSTRDPRKVLSQVVERGVPVMDIVTSSHFATPEASSEIAKFISNIAFQLGFTAILKELGHFNVMAQGSVLDGVPEVNPVQILRKGEKVDGKATTEMHVPFNIVAMRSHLNEVVESKSIFENNNDARQEHLESSSYDLALKQLEHRNKLHHVDAPRSADLQYWIWSWHEKLDAHLQDVIRTAQTVDVRVKAGKKSTPEESALRLQVGLLREILPCLSTVSTEKLSLMTILELVRMQGNGGVLNGMKAAAALVGIGKTVEAEFKSAICRQSRIPVADYEIKRGNYFSDLGYKYLHERRLAAARSQDLDERWIGSWSQAMRSKIGAFLVNALESVATVTRTMVDPATGEVITEEQPALYNAYEFIRGHKLGVLKFNDAVCERIAKDSTLNTVHARHLPMLVKPKPWISHNQGGYLYNRSSAMRFKECVEQEAYIQKATVDGKMEHIFAGLDVLGSTPWRINKDVFDIVIQVWNSGQRMGKIPPAKFDHPEPVLDKSLERDIAARAKHNMRYKVWAQANAANHSDRCSVNYKIEIARAFLGDVIYMPHNLDFRGRAYPIPPHLSHIGDDLSRSLLKFAEGKELGERGLRWLKIHAANLFGYDKVNFQDRVNWVDEHLEQIKECATNPLEGSRWWKKAGDPWQFLATCMELNKAFELEDPTTYVCAMPVHQDGTCNGLQHYAALGGDVLGAQQVNLLASDRPSDVYTHISTSVEAELQEDAAAGGEMSELARMLIGKITRKVVKQTVMTTVYGVTFIGAREQIEKQLKDRGDIPAELVWDASTYLAKKVLASIGDAFTGAKGIQDWLSICARLIAKSVPEEKLQPDQPLGNSMKLFRKLQMTTVVWTTKLGLPIVQPYRKIMRKQIRTAMQTLYISDPRVLSEVNTTKQASAFPPNFVHSLDATHMMLTALRCREHNLYFASVHDSYWTHPCDVDEMSEIIRDTFIMLHSSDILGSLDKEFRERYKNHYVALENIAPRYRMKSSNKFVQRLYTAGSRIYARRDQEAELEPIKELLIFTDDKSSIAVVEVDNKEPMTKDEADVEGDEENMELLEGKFVRLTDLLPPLPKKGSLVVSDIKHSPYFFS